jgi:putative chitinase
MAHPDWLAQFPGSVKSALWYWQKRGLNALADRDDILAVTRRINGGQNGLSEREYLTMKFKGVLGL